jgi:secondary thiamine-phosphate synthase enzyme
MFYFEFYLNTKKDEEVIDITDQVEQIIKNSNIKNGIVHIYVPHATAGIILNESADPNIKTDFLNALNKLVPKRAGYLHDRIDGNAAAHIKSSLVGSSITLPLKDGRLILGTWQSIMFCEFDGPRNSRKVIVQII